jgi:hypothetical protein
MQEAAAKRGCCCDFRDGFAHFAFAEMFFL